MDVVISIFAVMVVAMVVIAPTVLIFLLIYHGEKSRRGEPRQIERPRPSRRGFEVILKSGGPSADRSE